MPDSRIPPVRLAVIAGLLALSCATLIGSVIPARDGLHRTQKMLDDQHAANVELEERLDSLAEEERALREDPWVNGRILRTYGLLDEGEIVVR